MSVADSLNARLSSLIAASPDPVPDADSASTADGARPPPASAAGVESASGVPSDDASAGESPDAPEVAASPEATKSEADARAELYRAKLQAIRDANRERRSYAEAQAAAERARGEAEAARKAAEAEREQLAAGRKDFRKFFEANGMSAREAYDEMTRQAIEDGKPEALIKRLQDEWKAESASLKSELEALKQEREAARKAAEQAAFLDNVRADYAEAIKGASAYDDLRDAYADEQLIAKATEMIRNPEAFHEVAARYKVRLTSPRQGFTMTDILNVFAAVNAEYETGKSQRRAARTAATNPSTAAPQAAESPKVNGTSAPRNAGATPIGNDLTTARASDGKFAPKGATAAMRVRERVRRLSGG